MTTTKFRTKTKCAYCQHIGEVPSEWLGEFVNCCQCHKCYKAIEVMPEIEQTDFSVWHNDDDCRGGMFSGLIFVAGFWAMAYSMVKWFWY